MIDNKAKDNATFAAIDTIPNGYIYTQGPKRCKNTGKLLYQLSTDYKSLGDDEDEDVDAFTAALGTNMSEPESKHPKHPFAVELRQGHFICMTTFADHGFKDLVG